MRRNGFLSSVFGPSKEEIAASKAKQEKLYRDTILRKLNSYDAPYKLEDNYKEIGRHSAKDMVQATWRDFQTHLSQEPYRLSMDEAVEIGREVFEKRKADLLDLKSRLSQVKRNPSLTSIPNLHKYSSEQDKARLTAAFIGHRLGMFQPASRTSMVAGCERCGATVTISDKNASGLAVMGKCIA